MFKLNEILVQLKPHQALLHYNISSLEQFKAAILAVRETNIPLILGVSESERDFWDETFIKYIIDFYKKDLPIFLNADHCRSKEKTLSAIYLDYDAALFDGSELSFEDNVRITREIVEIKKSLNKETLVEGEVGYLPTKSSEILKEEVSWKEEYYTDPEKAKEFVEKTSVDLLAVSIGTTHGLPVKENKIDFERIKRIRKVVKVPLVMHGGSGTSDEDIKKAIMAGIKIVHLSSIFRKTWRDSLSENLQQDTIAPYKILEPVIKTLKEKIIFYQKLCYGSL